MYYRAFSYCLNMENIFMSENKSLKVNSVLNIIKTIANIAFPLITFPYISRVLLPENVGKVSFGASFVSYFSLVASLGITTYAIRECSAVRKDRTRLGVIASEIFSINLCTTLIAYILLAVSLLTLHQLDSYRNLIIIQSSVIIFNTLGADWLNSAMEDFMYITIRSIAFQLVSLVLMFSFVRTPDDYLKYAAISVLSSSGANLVNMFYRKRFCRICFTGNMHWQTHFKPILLLFVMIMSQTVFNSADVTMLGLMKGDFEVGLYSTAHKLQNVISQVVSSLAWVVMPRMSLYFAEGDFDKINNMLKKTFSIMIMIGLPCVAGCIALSKEIVLLVGGEHFIGASIPFAILILSFLFSLLGGSFLGNMVLLPSKQEGTYMKICCITTIVNVILNYILIPFFGAIAAASTTAISAVIILLLLLITKDKRIKLDYIIETSKSPLVGSVLIFVVCIVVKQLINDLFSQIIVSVLGSIVVYAVAMFLLKNEILMELLCCIHDRRQKKKR